MCPNRSLIWPPGDLCRALLRAIGLDIVAANLPQPWEVLKAKSSGQTRHEEAKVILQPGFGLAVARCSIHLLPITVLVGLIWINYTNLYIGPTFVEDPRADPFFLAGIQLAAKIQELLCVGSLTTIVLHLLRIELLGEGIPLGLLGSGIWFSSLSSLWSPELWGALKWSRTSLRRARFVLLLVLAGVTATAIGPASAVLMLPRVQNVPAGGTSAYLDSSNFQYWPGEVTASTEPEICTFPNATSYAVCPSGGHASLKHNLKTLNYATACRRTGRGFSPGCQAMGTEGNRKWNNFLIQSSQSLVPPVLNSFQLLDRYEHTVAIQPHAASVIKMEQLVLDWNSAAVATKRRSLSQFQWTYGLETLGSAISPWVRVKCTAAQNLTANATEALFPYLSWRNETFPDNMYRDTTFFSQDARQSSIPLIDRPPSWQLRTRWVSLQKDTFGTTTGLLIEMPWEAESRIALGCSVAAAWHPGLIRSIRSTSYAAWSVKLSGYDYGNHDDSPDAFNSNRPVRLDESWLRLLTAPRSNAANATAGPNALDDLLITTGIDRVIEDYRTRPQPVFSSETGQCERVMMQSNLTATELWNDSSCEKGDKIFFIEMIVASLLADGLSRHGSSRAYILHPDTRDWQRRPLHTYNSTRLLSYLSTEPEQESMTSPSFWLEVYAQGYAYFPSSKTDHVALAVVCMYMLIAGLHVVGTLSRPRHCLTSDTWVTLTELLVLCQNSPPPVFDQLKNASAGIHRQKTFATMVKVRVSRSANMEHPSSTEQPPSLRPSSLDASDQDNRPYGGHVRLEVEDDDEVICRDEQSDVQLLEINADGCASMRGVSLGDTLQQREAAACHGSVEPGVSYG
ncbi:hypothetical protein Q7P37_008671 [Cladosporium fusiforme]